MTPAANSAPVREVAEYPNSFVPLGPGDERIETDRYTLCLGVGATVQRQRFADSEVDAVLAEVRGLLRNRGRSRTQWELGSEAVSLVEPLLRRGLVRDADPVAIALVLDSAPPQGPGDLAVRAVASQEEYLEALRVQARAFGASPEEAAEHEEAAARRWTGSPMVMHGVWSDGAMVAAGSCAPTPVGLALFGGAVLPEARGRGAYRALIAARWELACAQGHPALLTQAGSMSRPILERLGFKEVGRVVMLRDELVGEEFDSADGDLA